MVSNININDCINVLKKQLKYQENGNIAFFKNKEKYKPYKINKKYFFEIKKNNLENLKHKRIAFIDGGNNTIFSAPNFCIVLNRISFCLYQNNKRLKPKIQNTIDFLSVCTSVLKENEIHFAIKIISDNAVLNQLKTEIKISSTDKTISSGIWRAKITKISDVARKYAEWIYALKIAKNQLNKGDILIRDGTLEARFVGETDFANEVYDICKAKKIIFGSVAKVNTLFSNTGSSFTTALSIQSPKNKIWYYYPVVDINDLQHRAKLYFAKLHKKTNRTLRIDVFDGLSFNIGDFFYLLAQNSKDPCFFGYPFGLVEAHKNAVVKNNELNYYKAIIYKYLDKKNHLDMLSSNNILK